MARHSLIRTVRFSLPDPQCKHLGLGVTTVQEWSTWPYAIDYGTLLSPRQVYDLMQRFRITHVLWVAGQSRSWDSLASDIMFFDFALHHTANRQRFGKKMLAELPSEPPDVDESTFGDVVAIGHDEDDNLDWIAAWQGDYEMAWIGWGGMQEYAIARAPNGDILHAWGNSNGFFLERMTIEGEAVSDAPLATPPRDLAVDCDDRIVMAGVSVARLDVDAVRCGRRRWTARQSRSRSTGPGMSSHRSTTEMRSRL